MNRSAKRKGGRGAWRVGPAALLAMLLLGAATWPLLSLAQPAGEAPVVRGQGYSLTSDGFIFGPREPDTSSWKTDKHVLMKFELKREGEERFVQSVSKVKAELDNENVPLAPGSLKPNSDPVRVLFMIDRSKSMLHALGGVNKLRAAKVSLSYFVGHLSPDEQVAIFAFDLRQTPYVELTGSQDKLLKGIGRIDISNDGSQFCTSLYGSIRYALEEAKSSGIQHVIFLSDGMEDTGLCPGAVSEGGPAKSKTELEEELGRKALEYKILVHTIAIGDLTAPKIGGDKERGVDKGTLENISKMSRGVPEFIDIPKLNKDTGGDPERLNANLAGELTDVLLEIKKRIQFDYEQPVALPNLQEGAGSFRLTVTVKKDEKYVPFILDYDISWDRGEPVFKLRQFGRLGLINVKPLVGWTGLAQIYFLLFLPLALLALLPSAVGRLATARDIRRMSHAITVVGRGSPLQGKQCPNEMRAGGQRFLFKEGDTALVCPKCHTPHHLSCWEYNQHRCMNRVCEYQFPIPERLLNKHRIVLRTKKRFV